MRSLFNMGFQAPTFNRTGTSVYALRAIGARRPMIGEGEVISKALRDQYVAKISMDRKKLDALVAWLNRSLPSDPMLKRALGTYSDAFWGANARLGVGEPTADNVFAVFQSTNPSDWVASATDLASVDDWAAQVDAMYAIMSKVAPTAAAVPGAGPLATGGTIFGIPTQTALIGGALAAGVITIIVALKG